MLNKNNTKTSQNNLLRPYYVIIKSMITYFKGLRSGSLEPLGTRSASPRRQGTRSRQVDATLTPVNLAKSTSGPCVVNEWTSSR